MEKCFGEGGRRFSQDKGTGIHKQVAERLEQTLENATARQRAEAPYKRRINNLEWMNCILKK
jgi:hypothetical protein